MTDEQNKSFSRRRALKIVTKRVLPILAWGGFSNAIALCSLYRQTEDAGQQRADRQQGRIVYARATGHARSSGRATATVISSGDRTTIPI